MKKECILAALMLFAGAAPCALPAHAEEEESILPLAHYRFDDTDAIGADLCGNFPLTLFNSGHGETYAIAEEDGEKFLRLSRNEIGRGACLYAPRLGGTQNDFSDLVEGSFSVGITFRRDNTTSEGDHYLLCLGKYNDALQITPWKNGIQVQTHNVAFAPGETSEEKQRYMESVTTFLPCDTRDWTSVFITEDAGTNTAAIYINGEKKTEVALNGVRLARGSDEYAFSIGGQCKMTGADGWMFATADIKECAVYGCCLTEEAVSGLYAGRTPVRGEERYIRELAPVEGVDTLITNTNCTEEVLLGLPKFHLATLSDGTEEVVRLRWFIDGTRLRGYVRSTCQNPSVLFAECLAGYGVKIEADESRVLVEDLSVDGQPVKSGDRVSEGLHTLTFAVSARHPSVTVKEVRFGDMVLDAEEGQYRIDFGAGAAITILSEAKPFTVTYLDGTAVLGTSSYTYGGEEPLAAFSVEGKRFSGWYLDEALTREATALNYLDPADVTLYGKFEAQEQPGTEKPGTEQPSGDPTEEQPGSEQPGTEPGAKGGCSGAIGAGAAAGLCVLAAGAFLFKKKE